MKILICLAYVVARSINNFCICDFIPVFCHSKYLKWAREQIKTLLRWIIISMLHIFELQQIGSKMFNNISKIWRWKISLCIHDRIHSYCTVVKWFFNHVLEDFLKCIVIYHSLSLPSPFEIVRRLKFWNTSLCTIFF